MNHRLAFLLLAVAACSKHDDPKPAPASATGTAAATGTASASATGTAAAPTGDLPSVDKIDCTKQVPQALVDKYFAGAKVTTATEEICEVATDDLKVNFNIEYQCVMTMDPDDLKVAGAGLTPVPDLGRGAVQGDGQIHVLDTDTNCLLNVTYVKDPPAKLVDFTRELLTHVP